jgi:nucleotide-binding universal stress UspA family protein
MFQNVLFPFDGSAKCMLAASEIVAIVKTHQAQLRVLYVNRGIVLDVLAFQDLQTDIARLLETEGNIPHPTYHMSDGKADEEILRFAKHHRIDLIAIPSRGLSRIRRFFSASTTESVVQRSSCPVWIIPERGQQGPKSRRVVCGISHTREANTLVREAQMVRDEVGGELTLVYAVPELDEGTLARMSQDPPFLSVSAARRYLQALAQSAGVHADCLAEVGPETAVFPRVAAKLNADVLVVDRYKRSSTFDVTTLSRRARCPVLVTDTAFARERLRRNIVTGEVSFAGAPLVMSRRRVGAR